jgi:hypothetical protein
MAHKGFSWAAWMTSRPLPQDLAWKSFTHQLQLGMILGKKSLKVAMSMGKFIDSIFPNEQVWIEMGGENFLVSPRSELENF